MLGVLSRSLKYSYIDLILHTGKIAARQVDLFHKLEPINFLTYRNIDNMRHILWTLTELLLSRQLCTFFKVKVILRNFYDSRRKFVSSACVESTDIVVYELVDKCRYFYRQITYTVTCARACPYLLQRTKHCYHAENVSIDCFQLICYLLYWSQITCAGANSNVSLLHSTLLTVSIFKLAYRSFVYDVPQAARSAPPDDLSQLFNIYTLPESTIVWQ